MKSFVRFIRPIAGLILVLPGIVAAQPRLRPPASYVQPTPPDAAEGAAILDASRNIGLSGPFYEEFELRILPRHGEESTISGRWFGSRNELGPVSRIELVTGDDQNQILIVQSGRHPFVLSGKTGEPFEKLDGERAVQPLAGSDLSAADLQTPFMFWTSFVYEGLMRFRGRPTHVFILYPPEDEAGWYPGIGGARVFIDTAYDAISQAQWLDEAGSVLKTITILDLKKVQDRWIVKSFEVRNERTRDKTRFVVDAAAVQVTIPDDLFDPSSPAQATAWTIPDELITRIR